MHVKITYCWECGYGDQVVDLTKRLLTSFEDSIEDLTIVPGADGIFDVEVDGKLLHSKHKAGWFPEWDELKAKIKSA
jgi:selenoprotein W-related protein